MVAPLGAGAANRRPMGLVLQTVAERLQRRILAAVFETARDQPVGQRRVLGQDRSVEIAPERVSVLRALGAVFPIVAAPVNDLGHRLDAVAKPGQAAVVFEPDQLAPLALRDDVTNEALVPRFGLDIEDADARQGSGVVGTVDMAEELVTATDGERGSSMLDRVPELLGLVSGEVVRNGDLFLILPSP